MPGAPPSPNESATIAQNFLTSLEEALAAKNVDKIVALFKPAAYWRDMLCIDKSDFNTLETPQIAGHLEKYGVPQLQKITVTDPQKAVFDPAANWLQAFFSFEMTLTRGTGLLRLQESAPGQGDWKAFTLFTAVSEVKGHEERLGERRPFGTIHGERSGAETRNWAELREEAKAFANRDPKVLIIGSGQNGLNLGARLNALGIDTLIVEKNERVGDNWRNRYKSLTLHDPVWSDHFAYLQFPKHWPVYSPKDKLANWMEHYTESMELVVWNSTTIERNPVFDSATGKWTVNVLRAGQPPRQMHVEHLVLATGFSGEAKYPTFPRDEFKGTVIHSSLYKGPDEWKGKKVVVVGACNSSHDVCQALAEVGADVTMVQRSSTHVISSEFGIPGLLNGFYEENGPPLEDADTMLLSLPVNLLAEFHVGATEEIAKKDHVILDGLRKAGFKINQYKYGLFVKYFRDGGGYYIDVGASTMIAEGKIKIKQGVEVTKLTKDGVLFADGTELKADLIVLATGYDTQRTTIKKIISDDVAKSVGPVWGEDSQGEISGAWRNSGVRNFWIQSGNLFQARCYSKYVALQIQMQLLGLVKPEENVYPKYKVLATNSF